MMKVIVVAASYLAALFLGAYLQSLAYNHLPTINQKFAYQVTLNLPRNDYDLKRRMLINMLDRELLEEVQKKGFFPSPDQEKK